MDKIINDIMNGSLTCLIAESSEAYANLENPEKCLDGARYFVREYCKESHDKYPDFENFLKWLSARNVYQETFGAHFVKAWNDEVERLGVNHCIVHFLKADDLYMKYLRRKPFANCIKYKEPEKPKTERKKSAPPSAPSLARDGTEKKESVSFSAVAAAIVFLAIAIIVAACIIRSRPNAVQHRFQKMNNGMILNVETGEVKEY